MEQKNIKLEPSGPEERGNRGILFSTVEDQGLDPLRKVPPQTTAGFTVGWELHTVL